MLPTSGITAHHGQGFIGTIDAIHLILFILLTALLEIRIPGMIIRGGGVLTDGGTMSPTSGWFNYGGGASGPGKVLFLGRGGGGGRGEIILLILGLFPT